LLLVSLFLSTAAPHSVAPAQQPGPAHKVQGAVRAVDVRTRALEVTTGVGMALRVVRLQVPAPLSLAGLRPGDVVRVSYGARPGGYVAYTIERLERTP
jgi:hypothetical protein